MTVWIDREAALARLQVKPQTLYAYVSRGRIRVERDPADSRKSRYNADDIGEIAARKARARKPAAIAASSLDWGEPAMPTRLSTVYQGRLFYRGEDAMALARQAKLEEVAALLWETAAPPAFASPVVMDGQDPFALLAAFAAQGQPIIGRSTDHLAQDAAVIIAHLALVCGAASGHGALHERLARGWGCGPAAADRIRQALVAMADHDLNASTFAARVAASTGASLSACLLAGLCTLSGPRHGGAGAALQYLLADARHHGRETAIRRWLEQDRLLPGFGHNLYPDGDPRGALMLSDITPPQDMQALADCVLMMTGLQPNCDFALAAMTRSLGLPDGAPFRVFLLGRAVGWCAHVFEQNREGTLIRPRGRYEGVLPV